MKYTRAVLLLLLASIVVGCANVPTQTAPPIAATPTADTQAHNVDAPAPATATPAQREVAAAPAEQVTVPAVNGPVSVAVPPKPINVAVTSKRKVTAKSISHAPTAVKELPPPQRTTPASAPAPITVLVPAGASVHGHIDLIVGPGQNVSGDEISDAVVYFIPATGVSKPTPGRFIIYTRNKQFDPTSLVIPVGSTVTFPNQDEILHNVFSATPGSNFDLGIYGEGTSASYIFTKPGLILINCNVHRAMQAQVLVLDTPYFVHPSANGDFRLKDLPSGAGKLMLWHPRAAVQTSLIHVPTDAAIGLRLELTKPRVAAHLNKEGRAYQRDRN